MGRMANGDSTEALREAIKAAGVAEVARVAEVKPTTLYSFCSGATSNLRSDTKDKVMAALRQIKGEPEPDTAEIVDIWGRILDAEARKQVLDFARWKAREKKSRPHLRKTVLTAFTENRSVLSINTERPDAQSHTALRNPRRL
jgi:predicted transcriptional regulator